MFCFVSACEENELASQYGTVLVGSGCKEGTFTSAPCRPEKTAGMLLLRPFSSALFSSTNKQGAQGGQAGRSGAYPAPSWPWPALVLPREARAPSIPLSPAAHAVTSQGDLEIHPGGRIYIMEIGNHHTNPEGWVLNIRPHTWLDAPASPANDRYPGPSTGMYLTSSPLGGLRHGLTADRST